MEQTTNTQKTNNEQTKVLNTIDKMGFLKMVTLTKEQKQEYKTIFNDIIATIKDEIKTTSNDLTYTRYIKINNDIFNSFMYIFDRVSSDKIKIKNNDSYILDALTLKKILGGALLDMLKNNKDLTLTTTFMATCKQFYKICKVYIDVKLNELKVQAALKAEQDFFNNTKKAPKKQK